MRPWEPRVSLLDIIHSMCRDERQHIPYDSQELDLRDTGDTAARVLGRMCTIQLTGDVATKVEVSLENTFYDT